MIRRPPRSTLFPYTTLLPIYLLHLFPGELEREKFHSRFIAVRRAANDANELVEVGKRDQVPFEGFRALFRLPQFETSPPQDHVAPVIDVSLVRRLERKQLRPPMIDRQHVDRERAFHRGV